MAYHELLIWQYKAKPRAKATAKLIEQTFLSNFKQVNELIDVLTIDKAQGVNLDLVGKHVGQSRVLKAYAPIGFFGFKGATGALGFSRLGVGGGRWYRIRDPLKESVVLNDEDFRFLIKARIIKNYQTATIPNLVDALNFVFGQGCRAVDNYNMTVSLEIPELYKTPFKQYALENLDILPRGNGVKFLIQWGTVSPKKYFGFNNAPLALGFSRQGQAGGELFTKNKGGK